ncbi:MAG: thioesterase domain-containing protein [Acetobacteraceae bacterium]
MGFQVQNQADIVDRPPAPPPTAGQPVSATLIAAIFERVLAVSPIDGEDDFFALGGDSILATAVALEIEQELGVALSLSTLFDAPTPVMLARAVAGRAAPDHRSMVLLKAGCGAPPVFLAPGWYGWPTTFGELARCMEIPGPIYGFRAPGLDGMEPPLARIEDFAERFLPAVRAVQPHGPYFLGGYSMGGLTAFELAQRLTGGGEEVALLALFDTYLCPRRLALASKLAVWRRRFAHHAASLKGKPWHALPPFVLARLRSLIGDLGIFARPSPGLPRPGDSWWTPAVQRVIEAGTAAAVAYRPRFYPGTVTYFEARDNNAMPGYPDLTWQRLAAKFVIHLVDGNHWQMMHERSADTARQFSACVRAALAAPVIAPPPIRCRSHEPEDRRPWPRSSSFRAHV